MMRSANLRWALCVLGVSATTAMAALPAADTVYRNGAIYTADAKNSVVEAIAINQGRIAYVGTDKGAKALIGSRTDVIDLHGQMLMPGLIDGHMHPLGGGASTLKCDLNYERLTVAQTQARIQKCLDDSVSAEPNGWLEVVNWFQEGALPAGTIFSKADLNVLKTQRPIQVFSSFGHTMLVNTRALSLAGISAKTADPAGGRIAHDATGEPTGILEDAAYEAVNAQLPAPTAAQNEAAARAALQALNRQGVTGFLDALASPESLQAFTDVQKAGALTVRAHFALPIVPAQASDPKAAIRGVVALAHQFDQGALQPSPGITVHNAKLFMDGVITAPAQTGALLEPYWVNTGTASTPHYAPGSNRGPAVYFAPAVLKELVLGLAAQGLEPHIHADGDAAVRGSLDAYQALRQRYPANKIRAAIAHNEMVNSEDFPRFGQLQVVPVLSMQWEKQAADTVDGLENFVGPARYPLVEPAGYLKNAGARIAFGSDWPVDALDEWFALKVGVTRVGAPDGGAQYQGRLGTDPGLTVIDVLRAATINAAYELHQDQQIGSLEVGKLADMIVLDRNVFKIPAQDIAQTHVLRTVVGGRVVYQSNSGTGH